MHTNSVLTLSQIVSLEKRISSRLEFAIRKTIASCFGKILVDGPVGYDIEEKYAKVMPLGGILDILVDSFRGDCYCFLGRTEARFTV